MIDWVTLEARSVVFDRDKVLSELDMQKRGCYEHGVVEVRGGRERIGFVCSFGK